MHDQPTPVRSERIEEFITAQTIFLLLGSTDAFGELMTEEIDNALGGHVCNQLWPASSRGGDSLHSQSEYVQANERAKRAALRVVIRLMSSDGQAELHQAAERLAA